ncbi:hypothetical protein ABZP36_001691 [Zizania latifolia]
MFIHTYAVIVAEAAAAGGGRVMDARSNDRCHVRSKTWKGYKLCLKHGTCNKPCRAEGFDYGSCYPELLHLQFVGDFFHVCFCSMNYCKT